MVRHTSRLAALLAALSWLSLLPAGSAPRIGAEEPPAKLDELRKERLAVAREIAKQVTQAYQAGTTSYDEVREATRTVLEAEFDLCKSDKERIAVLEKYVGEARKQEEIAEQAVKAGQAPSRSALKARAERLKAEIALEQLRSKVEGKPPEQGSGRSSP